MNSRTKITTCAITTITALACSSQLFAYPQESAQPVRRRQTAQMEEGVRRGRMQRGPDEHFDAVFKELNLTPEQQQKLFGQRSFQEKQRAVLREKMSVLRKEMTAELNKEKTDRKRLKVLVDRMKVLMGERIQHRVESILALKDILTPEQFKKLNEKMNRFEFRKGGRNEKISHHRNFSRYPRCRIKCSGFCQRLG
ncbi:MAG: Spy/CpxP family protein refolding chaperone [Candidatus Omnitrophica bacterium]|nr:Spy/CpxP family protein refolding chaperone [Candidatus Omnitrophota bacterium]